MSAYLSSHVRKRGRPKAVKADKFGTGQVGSPALIFGLRDSVAQVLPNMPTKDQNRLAEKLFTACGHFVALGGTRMSRGFRGRPFQINLTVLIRDCAAALAEVSGQQVFLWVDDSGQNSIAVELARICVELATGRPYPQSLKRQAARARDIFR